MDHLAISLEMEEVQAGVQLCPWLGTGAQKRDMEAGARGWLG
jgi:hypothetical protein